LSLQCISFLESFLAAKYAFIKIIILFTFQLQEKKNFFTCIKMKSNGSGDCR